jgi:transposase
LVANKFVDGIPIYRTCGQLERLGLGLSPSTAGTWVNAAGDKMTALVRLLHEELFSVSFIHMDESYLQVLKSDKAPTSTHYMVVRAGGAHGKRIVLFNYEASRTAEALRNLLIGPNGPYRGKLLTDGLDLYDAVAEALGLRHYGCLAHCRQYFDKAAKVTELPSGHSLARVALEDFLKQVYVIERQVKALRKAAEPSGIAPFAQILALRQKEAAPIMAAFKKWVDDLLPGVPPKTALGKALAYTARQWEKLSRFLSDPEMSADNNYCENQIRPFAVGRRAWLFVDSQLGAKASANLYSIVMTCRANGIEPYAYLCHVFEEFPKAKTAEQLEALLPWNAKVTLDAAAAQTDAELAA